MTATSIPFENRHQEAISENPFLLSEKDRVHVQMTNKDGFHDGIQESGSAGILNIQGQQTNLSTEKSS